MLVATMGPLDGPKSMLMLVIDRENVQRLQADEPIVIDLEHPRYAEIDRSAISKIMVTFSEPLELMILQLQEKGLLTENATIHPKDEGPSAS